LAWGYASNDLSEHQGLETNKEKRCRVRPATLIGALPVAL
jgi:hypothetical protein